MARIAPDGRGRFRWLIAPNNSAYRGVVWIVADAVTLRPLAGGTARTRDAALYEIGRVLAGRVELRDQTGTLLHDVDGLSA